MKKLVAIALCGGLLAGCSRNTGTNVENGMRRSVNDVENGVRKGVDGIEDGVEDMFDHNQRNNDNYRNDVDENNKRNTTNHNGVGKNVNYDLHNQPSLDNVPSYSNATMGRASSTHA